MSYLGQGRVIVANPSGYYVPLVIPGQDHALISPSDLIDHVANAVSVEEKGAKGDGSADDSAAFEAAIAAGDHIIVPKPAIAYRLSRKIVVPSGKTIVGGAWRSKIRLISSTETIAFDLSGASHSALIGLDLDGSLAAVTTANKFISFQDANDCILSDCTITGAPSSPLGSIALQGNAARNLIERCYFKSCVGTAISLSGLLVARNIVRDCRFETNGGFGCRVGESANNNDFVANWTDGTYPNGDAFELIGVTSSSYMNRICRNSARGCGDNGISISGYMNHVEGNYCYGNANGGIGVWGHANTIIANHCFDNMQSGIGAGIFVAANYGGIGQSNVVALNVVGDTQTVITQTLGIIVNGNNYTQWAAGQTVTIGTYRYYGLNVYIAASAGVTGATAPVHTGGSVSDGTVTWTYVRSFVTEAKSSFNTVAHNIVTRATTPYSDADTWGNNQLQSFAAGHVP